MYSVFWLVVMLLLSPVVKGQKLEFGAGTVLVYESTAGDTKGQLVLRLARFGPDIVLEWENMSHQGTVHFFQRAVQKAKEFAVNSPFEPGIDGEFSDRIAKWLPTDLFQKLAAGGETKVLLNGIAAKFRLVGKDTAQLIVDKQPVQVPVLLLEDSRSGRWAFLDAADNPVLIRYDTPYFSESLTRVATSSNSSLRWIKKVPPIK